MNLLLPRLRWRFESYGVMRPSQKMQSSSNWTSRSGKEQACALSAVYGSKTLRDRDISGYHCQPSIQSLLSVSTCNEFISRSDLEQLTKEIPTEFN